MSLQAGNSPNPRSADEAFPLTDSELPPEFIVSDLFRRLRQGARMIVLCAILGLGLGLGGVWWANRHAPVTTSTHVVFSFPGIERGAYPDHSEFQPNDVRSAALIVEALTAMELDSNAEAVERVHQALSIEGIVPMAVVQERDRLRAAGQRPAIYIPDEYCISLSLGRDDPLDPPQREALLTGIISAYRDRFHRTHAEIPAAFGRAFEALADADVAEYELILHSEVANIATYLREQAGQARSYRSPTTGFSFADLVERTEFFAQIRLNEALGLIHQFGLSANRDLTLSKMDYHLHLLESREQHALAEESVVKELLQQSQARTSAPVLAVPSQVGDAQVLDQGLIDSLLVNDSHNFLVRRALEAGLRTTSIQAEKSRLRQLRNNMRTFPENGQAERSGAMAQAEASFRALQTAYDQLIDAIRRTYRDFAVQRYADAVRMSRPVETGSNTRRLGLGAILGGGLGFAFGAGVSLVRTRKAGNMRPEN